jgi:glycosyltransferase involved in cell wall biosynthesis
MRNKIFIYTDSSLNNWQGYVFYIINTLNALVEVQKGLGMKINITLICSAVEYEKLYKQNIDHTIPILDLNRKSINKFLLVLHRIGIIKKIKFITLSKCTVFPVMNYKLKKQFIIFNWTKLIYWIPDFQHLALPNFFSKEEISIRNNNITKIFSGHGNVVLSSFSAKNDFKKHFNFKEPSITVLNFRVSDVSFGQTLNLSEWPKKYFLISNQFWLHKNHKIVLDAISCGELLDDVVFVITGKTEDYRDEEGIICDIVNEFLKQDQRVILTGFVDNQTLLHLIKNAHAVVQPSLFEGWNTVIEYAQLFNKVVVVSNLEVHFEQLASEGFYFEPNDFKDFSKKLNEVWELSLEKWRYETDYKEKQFTYSRELYKIVTSG